MVRNLKKKTDEAAEKGETSPKSDAKISLLLADGSLYNYQGSFNFADRQVDPATGTILFQVAFPNPDRLLRPGQFARIQVVIEEVKGALLIPQRCVRELQGNYQVYTISDSSTISMQSVKLGPKVGGMWIVENGLSANQKIVFEGLNLVRPGQKVEPETVKIPEELIKF
jgi:membrane fusion protein (multidrug efflux system)